MSSSSSDGSSCVALSAWGSQDTPGPACDPPQQPSTAGSGPASHSSPPRSSRSCDLGLRTSAAAAAGPRCSLQVLLQAGSTGGGDDTAAAASSSSKVAGKLPCQAPSSFVLPQELVDGHDGVLVEVQVQQRQSDGSQQQKQPPAPQQQEQLAGEHSAHQNSSSGSAITSPGAAATACPPPSSPGSAATEPRRRQTRHTLPVLDFSRVKMGVPGSGKLPCLSDDGDDSSAAQHAALPASQEARDAALSSLEQRSRADSSRISSISDVRSMRLHPDAPVDDTRCYNYRPIRSQVRAPYSCRRCTRACLHA